MGDFVLKLEGATAQEIVRAVSAISAGHTIFVFTNAEDAEKNLARRPLGPNVVYTRHGNEVWVTKKGAAQ